MSFGEAITDGLSKYATFSGRSSRSAFWWFTLFSALVIVAASLVRVQALAGLAWLALFLPNLAILVRRLHDTDRSGWWVLISFVPFVGSILLIVFACTDSEGPNKYGDGPDGRGHMTVIPPLGQKAPPPPPPVPPVPPAGQGPQPGETPASQMPPPQASERAPD